MSSSPPVPPSEPVLRRQQRDAVLVLTLNRPRRRNALSPSLIAGLLAAVEQALDDDSVGAMVLAGAGDFFCAGGDLGPGGGDLGPGGGDLGPGGGDLGPGGGHGEGLLARHRDRARFARLLLALVQGGKPVVAAVHGDALGGGTGLVAACQLVVAGQGARLWTPELRVGLFPWMIAPVLARKLPANVLHELILCGRGLRAEEALALGLVNRVLPRDQVLDGAVDLAARSASSSPAVRRMGLRALAATADQPLAAALDRMHAGLSLNLMLEDAAEGVAAFRDRRDPRWRGR